MQRNGPIASGDAKRGTMLRKMKAVASRTRWHPHGKRPMNAPVATTCVQKFTVHNRAGLLLRPAAILAKLADAFESEITIRYNGLEANARSLLGVVILQAGRGAHVAVKAKGRDAPVAMAALAELFKRDFLESGDNLGCVSHAGAN